MKKRVDNIIVGRFPIQNAFFVASLMALAQAVHINRATMTGASLMALTFAFLFFLIGFSLFSFVRRLSQNPAMQRVLVANQVHRNAAFIGLLKIAVLQQLWFFVSDIPNQDAFAVIVTLAAGAVILCFDVPFRRASKPPSVSRNVLALWHRQRPLLILTLHLFICVIYVIWAHRIARSTPDVNYFQRDGSRALLEGINPYTLRTPSIYPPDTPFYAPELVKNGILQFGYVYMPLTLLMALPGYLLGDVRISLLIAMSLCGWCLMQLKPMRCVEAQSQEHDNLSESETISRVAVLVSSLLLFFPFFLYFLVSGWTDSFVAAMFCIVVLCAFRRSPWLPVAVGLWLASKQYVVVMLPLIVLLFPASTSSAEKKRFFGVALGAALVVSLPMILWNVREFVWSAVLLQFKQPLRDDALSFLVALKLLGLTSPFWLPFVAAIGATVWALRQSPRNVHGFCAACTLVFFVFVAWNKQAFINYYFVIFAMLCCTLATSLPEQNNWPDDDEFARPRNSL